MEKERKITAPEGCKIEKIEKVELIDGVAVVTFKEKERKLPKSWDEFCEMFPIKRGECSINFLSEILQEDVDLDLRNPVTQRKELPDRATAEAVLALCQLIQLRNCYNGDWVPDWEKGCDAFTIEFECANITSVRRIWYAASPLYFKTKELRDQFLHCFRPLIEKLKPLYGIKEGGEQ